MRTEPRLSSEQLSSADLSTERFRQVLQDIHQQIAQKGRAHAATLSVGEILPHEQQIVVQTLAELVQAEELDTVALQDTLLTLCTTLHADRYYFQETWPTYFSVTEFDAEQGHNVQFSAVGSEHPGAVEMKIGQGQFKETVTIWVTPDSVLIPTILSAPQRTLLSARGLAESLLPSTGTTDEKTKWHEISHSDAHSILTYLETACDANLVQDCVLIKPEYLSTAAVSLESLVESSQLSEVLLERYPRLLSQLASAMRTVDAEAHPHKRSRAVERILAVLKHYDIFAYTCIVSLMYADYNNSIPVLEAHSEQMPLIYIVAVMALFFIYSTKASQADHLRERNLHLQALVRDNYEYDDFVFDENEATDFDD